MALPIVLSVAVVVLAALRVGVDGTHVIGDGVALTPPMGWNSWNHFRCGLNEELIRSTADLLASSGLQKAGYVYVNLDDCWQHSRTPEGVIVQDETKFPNFTGMIAYIKSKGLMFGLYTDRGTYTCQHRPGSYSHEMIDAKTYAAWGVDYVKNDDCNVPKGGNADTDYGHMFEGIHASGRPMVHSVKGSEPIANAHNVSNMRRVGHDIGDNFGSMLSLVMQGEKQNLSQYAHPGFWNDLDMLEIGNGGMTLEEYKTHMAFWCILKAPLLLGNDLTKMTADILAILTNAEVLAINQDPMGVQGKMVHQEFTNSTKSPRDVVAVKCSSSVTQQWVYDKTNMTIMNKGIGLCIDCHQGRGQVMAMPCDGSSKQQWVLDAGGEIHSQSASSKTCLDVYNYSGPVVQMFDCKDEKGKYGNQQFNVTTSGEIVPNVPGDLCLDLGEGTAQLYVFAGPLSGNAHAAMLFSELDPSVSSKITAMWSDMGLDPTTAYIVRDLWENKDIGTFNGSFSAGVAGHSNVFVKLTPV
ncbi:uncharacterized protein LOC135825853 [Sycon ciliatum]|uniref:uncharacterized protein LOC135825853 n=1 Tax=Sycon ciliatum TaxID=27933 RepID=UPI0031F6FE25